jgi:hypothetical protein
MREKIGPAKTIPKNIYYNAERVSHFLPYYELLIQRSTLQTNVISIQLLDKVCTALASVMRE